MSETKDWNTQVIEEFRANGGKVGGGFDGISLLLLHTTGARSGRKRISPVVYQDLGGAVAVFASNGGADTHPAWYHNLVADPDVTVEIGDEARSVHARIAAASERTSIWEKQKTDIPSFADYEAGTDREIPVVILDPA